MGDRRRRAAARRRPAAGEKKCLRYPDRGTTALFSFDSKPPGATARRSRAQRRVSRSGRERGRSSVKRNDQDFKRSRRFSFENTIGNQSFKSNPWICSALSSPRLSLRVSLSRLPARSDCFRSFHSFLRGFVGVTASSTTRSTAITVFTLQCQFCSLHRDRIFDNFGSRSSRALSFLPLRQPPQPLSHRNLPSFHL